MCMCGQRCPPSPSRPFPHEQRALSLLTLLILVPRTKSKPSTDMRREDGEGVGSMEVGKSDQVPLPPFSPCLSGYTNREMRVCVCMWIDCGMGMERGSLWWLYKSHDHDGAVRVDPSPRVHGRIPRKRVTEGFSPMRRRK